MAWHSLKFSLFARASARAVFFIFITTYVYSVGDISYFSFFARALARAVFFFLMMTYVYSVEAEFVF